MTRICAWCKKVMGKAEGPEQARTHGICWPCMFRQSPRIAMIYAWRKVAGTARALPLDVWRLRVRLYLFFKEQPGELQLLAAVTAGLFVYALLLGWWMAGAWPCGR